jgi:D-alanyl-D-alanine dipeptidase
LKTGKEVKMPSGCDEMTDRAFADYAGGTADERARRALLRQAMEKQDFTFETVPYEFQRGGNLMMRVRPLQTERM